MPLISRGALVAAVVLPLALMTPASSYADTWSAPDDSGDVAGWRFDPQPEPCGTTTDVDGSADANDDITRLVVRHTPRAVQVAVHFRDLGRKLEQSVEIHFGVPEKRGWTLDVDRVRTPSGGFRVSDFFSRELPEPDPADQDECGGWFSMSGGSRCGTHPSVDPKADRIRVTVPRRCLRNPDWVRVGATAYGWTEGDHGSYGGFHDDWGTPEEGASTWLPPFGPEVPVSGT